MRSLVYLESTLGASWYTSCSYLIQYARGTLVQYLGPPSLQKYPRTLKRHDRGNWVLDCMLRNSWPLVEFIGALDHSLHSEKRFGGIVDLGGEMGEAMRMEAILINRGNRPLVGARGGRRL